jgi:hypothetical protein
MSTKHHNPEHSHERSLRHADVSFEAKDINTRTILKYLLALALCVMVSFAACIYVFRAASEAAVDSERQLPPSHRNVGATLPPEPRLQGVPGHPTDPQLDLRNKIKEDTEANQELGYVDKQAGIARIPVEEAVKIIVSKGWPAPAPEAEKKR